jgi:hypothetical protein
MRVELARELAEVANAPIVGLRAVELADGIRTFVDTRDDGGGQDQHFRITSSSEGSMTVELQVGKRWLTLRWEDVFPP